MWRVERVCLVRDLLWTWLLFCMYLGQVSLMGRRKSGQGLFAYQGLREAFEDA